MAGRFSDTDWDKIETELLGNPEKYGMPEGGREESVVFASFNIRKLGKAKGRERELNFMARFCARCDLVAIQEVQDDLSASRRHHLYPHAARNHFRGSLRRRQGSRFHRR